MYPNLTVFTNKPMNMPTSQTVAHPLKFVFNTVDFIFIARIYAHEPVSVT